MEAKFADDPNLFITKLLARKKNSKADSWVGGPKNFLNVLELFSP